MPSTTSQVKSGLDAIADSINAEEGAIQGVLSQLQEVDARLAAIPSGYSEEIATINGYTPTGAYEELAKDELAKLTTEFQAKRAAVQSAITALGG